MAFDDLVKSYKYEPKWTKDIERHPDKRPSDGAMFIEDWQGRPVWTLKVRDIGAILISEDGLSIFSDRQMVVDPPETDFRID